ncbi:hypothetical protein [Nocardioides hungaricus]
MTPRRHRTFLDHKPPLVAFVLIAVASMALLVHVARSEAAPAWLRQGAAVMSGGAPLTRQVVERAPVAPQRDEAVAEAPVAAPSAKPAAAPATEPVRQPDSKPDPKPGQRGPGDGRPTPDLPSAPPASPTPEVVPGDDPPTWGSRGPSLVGHEPSEDDDGGRPDRTPPVLGSGSEPGPGGPWYGDDRGDRGDDRGHDRGDGRNWSDPGRGHALSGWGHD